MIINMSYLNVLYMPRRSLSMHKTVQAETHLAVMSSTRLFISWKCHFPLLKEPLYDNKVPLCDKKVPLLTQGKHLSIVATHIQKLAQPYAKAV